MQDFLSDKVTILTKESAESLIVDDGIVEGLTTNKGNTINAKYVILAPGREGAGWLVKEFSKLGCFRWKIMLLILV